jgi:hypothetical protein
MPFINWMNMERTIQDVHQALMEKPVCVTSKTVMQGASGKIRIA